MTDATIKLSEEAFAARFPLRTNHINPAAGWDNSGGAGCLFETFGDELAFVRRQNPRTVWTLIEGDDDSDQYVLSGFHLVNRIGYLVSTIPVPEGASIQFRIQLQSDEDVEAMAHTSECLAAEARVRVDFLARDATRDESTLNQRGKL